MAEGYESNPNPRFVFDNGLQVSNPDDAPIGVCRSHNVFDTATWCTIITFGNTLNSYSAYKQQICITWFSTSFPSRIGFRIKDGTSWTNWRWITFAS